MAFTSFSSAVALGLGFLLPCGAADHFFAVDADPFLGRVVASRASIRSAIEASLQTTCMPGDLGDAGDPSMVLEDTGKAVEARLLRTQRLLSPAYNALPKNARGRLGGAGVRYLLHRHFLHSRAWLVRGLAPAGGAWNASFPVEILKDWVPPEVRQVVTEHLQGRGLLLREVAVLATMLENQVRMDAVDRLREAYKALGLNVSSEVQSQELEEALDLHTMTYMLPGLLRRIRAFNGRVPGEILASAKRAILKGYPAWPQTQSFLRKKVAEVAGSPWGMRFEVAKGVALQAIEQYGRWQDEECRELKHELFELESQPGRVDLRTFYGEAVSGRHWQFSESMAYMRTLGVLDETDPANPSVLIPNYISSPSQYIANSHFFAVVCIDACEDLVNHVERRLGAPEASTQDVIAVVSALPSTSQPARVLDDTLVHELERLASMHGGKVPIHGRLFALWMHHAYPRDCPYPHAAGTTDPMMPNEYVRRTGLPYLEPKEAMSKLTTAHVAKKRSRHAEVFEASPWEVHEELLSEAAGKRPIALPSATEMWQDLVASGHLNSLAAGAAALALLGLAVVAGRARSLWRTRQQGILGAAQGHLLNSGAGA